MIKYKLQVECLHTLDDNFTPAPDYSTIVWLNLPKTHKKKTHTIKTKNTQDCASYTTDPSCSSVKGCLWSTDSSSCFCGSNVTMDIIFALDSSRSIRSDAWQIELDWLSDFITSSLSQSSRVSMINFAVYSRMILNFTDSEGMSNTQLADFVENDIIWYGSEGKGTNTYDAIEQSILLFDKYSKEYTTKVLLIFTDGNPCCPIFNIDIDICSLTSELTGNDINTYVLGVGDLWNPDKVDCLVQDIDNDIFFITSFNYTAFDEIMPTLTEITCPGMCVLLSCFSFSFV